MSFIEDLEQKKAERVAARETARQEREAAKEAEKAAEKIRKAEEKERTAHEKYMKAALKEAEKAYEKDEVPIGCVIVRNEKIIAKGYNRRNTDKTVLGHAEITAIRDACKKTGDWRLEDCTMYVTLEPCQMCAGAIVQARMARVVIGSMNAKAGCAGSVLNLLQMEQFNHQVEIIKGIREEECSALLSGFFTELRKKQKKEEAPAAQQAMPEERKEEAAETTEAETSEGQAIETENSASESEE